MKRLFAFISMLAVGLAVFTQSPVSAATNLITNPSAETVSGSVPTGWTASKWGTQTSTLSVKAEGHTGTKSLYVNMTAYTNGDSKWMHNAVNVQANTPYTYTSWYKSNINTNVILQYTSTTGVLSYVDAATITPSTAWKELSTSFTPPANTTKVTVLHVVAQKGWLQTDDFSLTATETTPPPTTPTPTPTGNLIANNSFETVNGTFPSAWYRNTWGVNNAQFTYETTGRTGSKSVKITVGTYTSGDAKWYAEPVAVTAGKVYTYQDYYKANVVTRVVAAFTDTAGNYTYQELATAPTSATAWKEYKGTITAPTNATKMAVYHLIDRVGNLTLDDTSLTTGTTTTPPPTTPTNPILNPSLETVSGTLPVNWQSNSWGSNTSVFTYENTGRTGTKSAKVTMSNYVDGDAKWFFNPIVLQQGGQYRFTTWYKTNVTPHAVAMFTMNDGTQRYFGMPITQPSGSTTTWQKYSDTFSIPTGAASVSVFLYINQNGWLQTDDYSLESYTPTGFNRALLSMTFDDGHEENATSALPLLNQYGLKTTQCFATSFIEGQSQQVVDGVLAFKNSGHEVCSHSVTHPELTTVSPATLTYEAQHSKQYLEALVGLPVVNFASPYGDYNAAVNTELKKYYRSHRTTDEGYNSKDNFAPYSLRVQNILDTTTADDVSAWIEKAKANKTWLILVYHRIGDNPGPYDSTLATFQTHVQKIAASGITVTPVNAALDELTPQLP